MMISTSFDYDIAMNVGVQESILHSWISENIKMSIALDRTSDNYDNRWWCKINSRIEEDFFPFWTHAEIVRFCEALTTKGYARLRADVDDPKAMWISLEATRVLKKKKRDTAIVAKEEAEELINYTRTLDTGMTELVSTTKNKLVAEMIDMFKYVSPSYTVFFSRKVERDSLKRLIDSNVNVDNIFKLLKVLPQTNKMQFAPVITRPSEFERNYSKLVAFIQRQQSSKQSQGFKISM